MFKGACNGEQKRFIVEKLRSIFAIEGGTNKIIGISVER